MIKLCKLGPDRRTQEGQTQAAKMVNSEHATRLTRPTIGALQALFGPCKHLAYLGIPFTAFTASIMTHDMGPGRCAGASSARKQFAERAWRPCAKRCNRRVSDASDASCSSPSSPPCSLIETPIDSEPASLCHGIHDLPLCQQLQKVEQLHDCTPGCSRDSDASKDKGNC